MLQLLRVVVGIAGAILLAIGLALLAAGGLAVWPGIQLVLVGVIGLVVAFFERLRYGTSRDEAASELRPTDERFIDPTTGQRTRVWIDPASGERTYRPD